jgi:PTH1 family peptidyl-tRNA hydrolase
METRPTFCPGWRVWKRALRGEFVTEQERWLVAGLGNPGARYAHNRHNVGFQCVDHLAHTHGLTFDKRHGQARLAFGSIHERPVILLKSRTYMNDSGRAVAPVARFHKVPLDRLLVVYDDLDLPVGSVRIRAQGGSGGHGGMRSIINHVGGQDFPRVRIGIGRPPGRMDPADFVLRDFDAHERALLAEVYAWVARAIECWLTDGIEIAMTRFNRVRSEE